MAVSFFSRRIFADVLGVEYLGLNSMFGDTLNLLSLAELGIANSMLFSLYRPVALGDTEKVRVLMNAFRKIYLGVGVFILAAGAALCPVSKLLVTEMDTPVDHIWLIFLMNVVNTGVSYFFIYRATLLFADQKKYVETLITTAVRIISGGVQIASLILWGNYFVYLGISILATMAINIWITVQTNRMYPYLRKGKAQPLDPADKGLLKRNVFANALHKVGGVVVFYTDTLIMGKMVSVAAAGIYSNYMVIRIGLLGVIHPVFHSITATMGHLNATETAEHRRWAFENLIFFSAWLFGCICVTLAVLYNPFILLWMGSRDFAFPEGVVLLIVVNLYLYCMRLPIGSARETFRSEKDKEERSLFQIDKYKVIPESALNLVLSVWWTGLWGIPGILWGTVVSTLLVPFWVEPWVIYRWGFNRSCAGFMFRYTVYFAVTCCAYLLCRYLCGFTHGGAAGLFEKLAICIAATNAVYLIAYHRLKEFDYLKQTAAGQLSRLAGRFGRRKNGQKGSGS
ncbi:MAG: hypothetical protein J5758_01010, partial [Abditibacteriota bacterium]|nr:hypothetical protein [Abditibacteriota bacterium]